jgi:hypothetical protein
VLVDTLLVTGATLEETLVALENKDIFVEVGTTTEGILVEAEIIVESVEVARMLLVGSHSSVTLEIATLV